MVVQIPLTRGLFALVDESDYPRISAFKWHATRRPRDKTWYAVRSIPRGKSNGQRSKEFMHRIILGVDGFVDHKDGNGLNNTRQNIRPASVAENNRNIAKPRHGVTSPYKGVSRHNNGHAFEACIRFQGKKIYLGMFKNAISAAFAYDAAARRLFGAFARPNFAPLPTIWRMVA